MDKDILSKITQGEWIAVKNANRSYVKSETADEVVCNCFTEANAEFLAHAPETLKQRDNLLEACKAAMRISALWAVDPEIRLENPTEGEALDSMQTKFEKAIADVEGST